MKAKRLTWGRHTDTERKELEMGGSRTGFLNLKETERSGAFRICRGLAVAGFSLKRLVDIFEAEN